MNARRTLLLAGAALAFMVALALFGPLLSPHGYSQTSERQFEPPSAAHWLGTDIHGRDVLTRVLHGARVSLLVGVIGATVSLTIGVIYGMVSAWCGGWIDQLMMRVVEVIYALPRIILVIILIALFDQKAKLWMESAGLASWVPHSRLILLFIGLGMVEWLTMARIVRGQVLALKERAFVQAARALGQSPLRILLRHLLPNLAPVILVYLTLTIPSVILEESFLSFLGLGVQAPQSSWGTLLSDGASLINPVKIYWWMLAGPGLFMAATLLALNFLGDALRDRYDPRLKRS
jgi:peptide/nickel transport system permease protein/oligopeptide transport system permease protein